MKMFPIAAAVCIAVVGMWPAESRAEFHKEPFSGDFVNESAQRVLIVGDDILGAGTGFQYGCQAANVSSHNWAGDNDIDFFYDPGTNRWCKIGPWEGKRFANGTWYCPDGWQTPAQAGLRDDLRC